MERQDVSPPSSQAASSNRERCNVRINATTHEPSRSSGGMGASHSEEPIPFGRAEYPTYALRVFECLVAVTSSGTQTSRRHGHEGDRTWWFGQDDGVVCSGEFVEVCIHVGSDW